MSPNPGRRRKKSGSSEVLESAAMERLELVARRGDPTLVARLVGLFLEDTPDRLDALRQAVERSDDATVRAVAHGLRGSSETFGAREMVLHCSFLEHMPTESDQAALTAHVEALIEAYDLTRSALQHFVGAHACTPP